MHLTGARIVEPSRRRLSIEERVALADRLERLANSENASQEWRAKWLRHADNLRAINQRLLERRAEADKAGRSLLREQLSHDHMILLAEAMVGWALSDPERVERWLALSDQLRDLADEVGPDWNPPEPERLSAMGFLARRMAEPR